MESGEGRNVRSCTERTARGYVRIGPVGLAAGGRTENWSEDGTVVVVDRSASHSLLFFPEEGEGVCFLLLEEEEGMGGSGLGDPS